MGKKLDALEAKLAATAGEKTRERVDALNALAWNVGFDDVHRSAELAAEATSLARELSYPLGAAWGLLNQAYRDYFVADYSGALDKANEAQPVFEELGARDGTAQVLLGLGMVHWSLGDFGRAVDQIHRGNEILRELALPEREAWGLTTLGGVYESIGDLDKAIACHQDALEKFRAASDVLGEGRALTGLGAALQKRGQLESALEHYQASLELSRKVENRLAESRALNDIGTVYRSTGDLDQAQEFLDRALALRRELGTRPPEVTSLLDLGSLALEKNDVSKALDQLQAALELATELRTKPKVFRAHELLALAYERAGDFSRALAHHRAFQRVKEEVLGEESATQLRNLELKFESETLEKLKHAQAQIVEAEKLAVLGKVIAGIAHELNTPAGVLRSSADTSQRAVAALDDAVRSTSAHEELTGTPRYRTALETLQQHATTVSQAGHRLAKIVENLKRFIHLDQATLQLTDLRAGIEATLELLEPQWGERIRVVRRFEDIPQIESYAAELNQALMTLLTNAGEAIEGEGTITVSASRENGRVRIRTSDTGRGIPMERVEKLFDIGFTQKGQNIRLQMGLAHVKATVHKHRGEIRVESEPTRGTTFEISLPVRQN